MSTELTTVDTIKKVDLPLSERRVVIIHTTGTGSAFMAYCLAHIKNKNSYDRYENSMLPSAIVKEGQDPAVVAQQLFMNSHDNMEQVVLSHKGQFTVLDDDGRSMIIFDAFHVADFDGSIAPSGKYRSWAWVNKMALPEKLMKAIRYERGDKPRIAA